MNEKDKSDCQRVEDLFEAACESIAELQSKLAVAERALEEIAVYDTTNAYGTQDKMWMRLGRKASKALAEIRKVEP